MTRWALIAAGLASGLGAAYWAHDRSTWPLMVAAALLSVVATALLYRAGLPGRTPIRRMLLVLGVGLVLRAAWLPLGPALSDDGYRYAWDGRLVMDGLNPYTRIPADASLEAYRSEPVYTRLNSDSLHTVYPPVSQGVFGASAALTQGRWPDVFFAVKGLALLFELLALVLLARVVAAPVLMLVAWHPVLLITGAGQGHTEAFALPFLVLAVLWVRRRWFVGAGAALAAAGLVKLIPFVAFPALAAQYGDRQGAVRASAGLAAIVILASVPFVASGVVGNVLTSLDLYVRYFEFNAGPYYAVKQVYLWITGDDWSKQIGPAFRTLYLLGAGCVLVAAWWRRWRFVDSLYALYAGYLVLATTVHPWYLAPVIVLAVLRGGRGWAWIWLGAWSVGTYLLYVGGPYWTFVTIGWTGTFFLMLWEEGPAVLDRMIRFRARWKADWVGAFLPPDSSVLDVGAGEGYVAKELARQTGSDVFAVDVRDRRCTDIPYQVFDGRRLPFERGRFDAVICIFVLHHADDPEQLIREMKRVASGGPIMVVESVIRGPVQGRMLGAADAVTAWLRAGGRRGDGPVELRTAHAWRTMFEREGMHVVAEAGRYNALHPKHLYVLRSVIACVPERG